MTYFLQRKFEDAHRSCYTSALKYKFDVITLFTFYLNETFFVVSLLHCKKKLFVYTV